MSEKGNKKYDYGTSYDYGTHEVQEELLKLLKDFHNDCIKNNIVYSLNSGTLLGAIRHNGFIPWDDDADVMMSRKDFEEFIKLENRNENYQLFRNLWIYRIKGIKNDSPATIDLFVVDNVPDNKIARSMKVFLLKIMQGTMKEKTVYKNYSLFYRVCLFITHLLGLAFSDNTKYKMYVRISCIGNGKKTNNVGIYNNLFRSLSRLYNPNMMNSVFLHTFEDTALCVTSYYDDYLQSVYGDYMTPPSTENRRSGNYKIICNNKHFDIIGDRHT